MLDYNRRPKFADLLNKVIDAGLEDERSRTQPRSYLGGSRLGHACERALQFEFAGAPKDEGGDFNGQTLRIFAIGHVLEDLAIRWLRQAGFDLYTRKGNRPDGEQFGFAVAGGRVRGHVDGILAAGPDLPDLGYPALWECKTMNAKNWRETVAKGVVQAKPVYAAQIALYQAYMDLSASALFTALNRDTWEIHCELVPFDAALAQQMSDRAFQVVQASDAQELLPRAAVECTSVVCRGGKTAGGWYGACSWQDRCWGTRR